MSYEYARKADKGRTVYARSVVVPEFDSDQKVVGFFVLSIDITEQRASEAALVQAQKMEAVGQLTQLPVHMDTDRLESAGGRVFLVMRLVAQRAAHHGGELAGPLQRARIHDRAGDPA